MNKRKYKTEAERKAAIKARQAAYYAARKNGTWVRKNRRLKGSATAAGDGTPALPKPSRFHSAC